VAEFGRAPTPSEQARLRVATNLTIRVDDLSARLANGERVDPGDVTMLSSELRRVLRGLHLEDSKAESDADRARREREQREAGLP
jgi:hypothetical protein